MAAREWLFERKLHYPQQTGLCRVVAGYANTPYNEVPRRHPHKRSIERQH